MAKLAEQTDVYNPCELKAFSDYSKVELWAALRSTVSMLKSLQSDDTEHDILVDGKWLEALNTEVNYLYDNGILY